MFSAAVTVAATLESSLKILTRKINGFIVAQQRAGIAQLVEYKLPKLGVASSNLVARSS